MRKVLFSWDKEEGGQWGKPLLGILITGYTEKKGLSEK